MVVSGGVDDNGDVVSRCGVSGDGGASGGGTRISSGGGVSSDGDGHFGTWWFWCKYLCKCRWCKWWSKW